VDLIWEGRKRARKWVRKKKLQTLGSEVKTRIRLYSKTLFYYVYVGYCFTLLSCLFAIFFVIKDSDLSIPI